MSQKLNDHEYQAVLALSAQERYQHLIKRIVDTELIWSLATDDGWTLAADEQGKEVVPIWPHERYAVACAKERWAGDEPRAVTLSDWMDKWLPGMSRDGRQVAVFPTPSAKGCIVSPERLQQDLQEELMKYE